MPVGTYSMLQPVLTRHNLKHNIMTSINSNVNTPDG